VDLSSLIAITDDAEVQVLPPLAWNVVRWRVHLAGRRQDGMSEDLEGHGYRQGGVADGHYQGLYQEPRDSASPSLPFFFVADANFPSQLFALEHMRDRYWHNMASRIQRAWRNYIRYKHECATRIQRFWRSKQTGIVFLQLRDYGHQVLASRKERRRFSLISMRRFMGDYLGVGEGGAQGVMLSNAAGIGCESTLVLVMSLY
jgi:hypothetical protein